MPSSVPNAPSVPLAMLVCQPLGLIAFLASLPFVLAYRTLRHLNPSLRPYLNNRAYPSLSRHYPADALATDPYFSPAIAGSLAYLAHAQREAGLKIFVQHSSTKMLYKYQNMFLAKMRAEGVEYELDVVKGGSHLDAGIAFALLERKPSSS
jgi:acetyl esterase/lipase